MTLRRLWVETLPLADAVVQLDTREQHHAISVLRLKSETVVEAIDGSGSAVEARLIVEKKKVFLKSHHKTPTRTESPDALVPLVLGLSWIKPDAMSWAVEKLCELGLRTLVPIFSDHAAIKKDSPEEKRVRDRLQTVADQSLKQSGRLTRLEILKTRHLDDFQREYSPLTFSERPGAPRLTLAAGERPRAVLIGPEGGWSDREASSFEAVASLGPLVLRAETAAVVALALLGQKLSFR